MSRTIVPSTPAFQEYGSTPHPVNKGGFGTDKEGEIKIAISGVDRKNTTSDGIIPLDENSKIIDTGINKSFDFVTISGPGYFDQYLPTEYKITNYSPLREYIISSPDTTLGVTADTIVIPAGITASSISIIVNGRKVTVPKIPATLNTPTSSVSGIRGDTQYQGNATFSGYVSTIGTPMARIEYQISPLATFAGAETVSVNGLTTAITGSTSDFYIRARFVDTRGEIGNWSTGLKVQPSTFSYDISRPSLVLTGGRAPGSAFLVGTANAMVSSVPTAQTGLEVEFSTTSDFASKITALSTESVSKAEGYMATLSDNYYARARYIAGSIYSEFSDVATVKYIDLIIDYPIGETGIVYPSDGLAGDTFGTSVKLSADGKTMITGAYNNDQIASNAGAAYIYDKGSDGSWTLTKKLTAPDGAIGDIAGYSTAISGNGLIAAMGAFGADPQGLSNSGAVYVFEKISGTWTYKQKIYPSNGTAESQFGYSLDMSSDGTYIIGGENGYTGTLTKQGRVVIFKRNVSGSWVQIQQLYSSTPIANSAFGSKVTMDAQGTRIAVPYSAGTVGSFANAGYVEIYKNTNDVFVLEQKISLANAAANDYFGTAVSIDSTGRYLAVSASGRNSTIADTGTVSVFHRSGTVWTLLNEVVPNDNYTGQTFGVSCSISSAGRVLCVSDRSITNGTVAKSGGAYVFLKTGNTWKQVSKLAPSLAKLDSAGDWISVSTDGKTMAISCLGASPTGVTTGSAVIFEQGSSKYRTSTTFQRPAGTFNNFGATVDVSLDGNTCVIAGVGMYAIYRKSSATWSLVHSWITGSNSGIMVCISGDGNTAMFADTGGNKLYYSIYANSMWTNYTYTLPASETVYTSPYFPGYPTLNMDGTILAAGGPGYSRTTSSDQSGRGYILKRTGTTFAIAKTIAAVAGNNFYGQVSTISRDGSVVAFSDRNVVTYSQGYIYLFKQNAAKTDWVSAGWITSPNPSLGDGFGISINMTPDGTYILVGANKSSAYSTTAGAAYLFKYNGTTWVLEQSFGISGLSSSAAFGGIVRINAAGDELVIGRSGINRAWPNQSVPVKGYIYKYRKVSGIWTLTNTITDVNTTAPDGFSCDIAAGATLDELIVGATITNNKEPGKAVSII